MSFVYFADVPSVRGRLEAGGAARAESTPRALGAHIFPRRAQEDQGTERGARTPATIGGVSAYCVRQRAGERTGVPCHRQ